MNTNAHASDPFAGRLQSDPVRAMIVEDSIVVRGLLARWLEAGGDIRVVASVGNGAQALDKAKECRAEVVILDIDMPVMDGIEALPKLLALEPNLKIVMSSTLTLRNAQISLKALSLGASDYVAKPDTVRGVTSSQDYRREIVEKVRGLAMAEKKKTEIVGEVKSLIRLQKISAPAPKLIVIGSSTGGPQALAQVLRPLSAHLNVPVLVTQHMPPMFTSILAEHLARVTGRPVHEAVDGETPQCGTIYVAPGGKHLLVQRVNSGIQLQLNDGAPENFCKPSVDILFRAVAQIYGSSALALVLTGMGHDGREGARALVAAGGNVIAQDQATSVVWGMPGAIAEAGLASAVLPLGEIAPKLIALLKGARP